MHRAGSMKPPQQARLLPRAAALASGP
jgi:hypothetical protein